MRSALNVSLFCAAKMLLSITRPAEAGREQWRRIARLLRHSGPLISWVGAVLFAPQLTFGQSHEDVVVRRVVSAWEARATRIHTATIEWTLRTTDRQGIFTEFAAKNGGPGGEVPAQDTTHEAQHRFVFDGRQLRLESNGEYWRTDTGSLHHDRKIRVFDGERLEVSMPAGTSRDGTLMSQAEFILLHSGEVLPIGLFIAPLNKEFGATALPPLEPRPNEPVSPGEICLAGQQGLLLLWVDQARPEIIRRFQVRKQSGAAWIEGEIEWSENAAIGPAPARWLVTTFDDDGKVRQVHDGRVTRCEFNAPIAESEWRITYPAGARFHDMIAQKEYVVDEQGELQPAGMAQAAAGQRGNGWLGYSLLAAALLAGMSWWRSRRMTSRSPF